MSACLCAWVYACVCVSVCARACVCVCVCVPNYPIRFKSYPSLGLFTDEELLSQATLTMCGFLNDTIVCVQGFSLTKSGLLRTTLQCVVVRETFIGGRPKLEDCIIGPRDQWKHTRVRQTFFLFAVFKIQTNKQNETGK